MNQNIKVTIGIPCYNAEKFLVQSIKSVLNQSFQNWELILVDDGSTDNSLLIARAFKDERIRIISDGTNKGISYRLNQIINEAKGEYFCRMDADDIMFPDRLAIQIKYLQENPNTDVVGSFAVVIDDDNNILGLRKTSIPEHIAGCFKGVPFIHPTVTGKTKWFKKYGYTNDLKGVEDADLWIRSFNESKFVIVPEPLLFYRDPLKLKLKTYRFRIRQSIRLIQKNKSKIKNQLFSTSKFIAIAIVKLFTYSLLNFLNLEAFIMKRRNLKLSEIEELKYASELKTAAN